MIVKSIQVGQIGTNCYLFGDETAKVCALVDPGDQPRDIARMVMESGMELKCIFITHGHFDHVLAVAPLTQLFPEVQVYIHQGELNVRNLPDNYMQMSPVPNLHLYNEGDEITVGDLTVRVLHTPGHSVGSVVLQVGEALFCGDTLFRGSCGRTDFAGGSYTQMMESLKRLAALPGDYQVYPGHDRSSTLEWERVHNSYMSQALEQG